MQLVGQTVPKSTENTIVNRLNNIWAASTSHTITSEAKNPSSAGASAAITSDPDKADPQDDLLAELSALRRSAKMIGLFGSRNIPLPHQQLIEFLAFQLVKEGKTIVTSGGSSGTNAAAIRGAMRANPQNLVVILPQTIGHQPSDVQDQLIGIPNIVEHPEWNNLTLSDASRLCNREVVDNSEQLILYLFHNSTTLLKTLEYAEESRKIVTPFYLD